MDEYQKKVGSNQPLIQASELQVWFRAGGNLLRSYVKTVKAVDCVSFAIEEGETFSLVGESGCGKTTTARALLRLEKLKAGSIYFHGTEITQASRTQMQNIRRNMQIVFQDPYASVNPRMTIAQIISEPMEVHLQETKWETAVKVAELLDVVGLNDWMASRYPHELSGGQLQRVGIARALALRPAFVVLDEPVSALDVSIRSQIINLLEDLQERFQLTYLLIAHDLGVVKHIAARVGVMYMGRIVELAHRDPIYSEPLHPYTNALISAVPIPDPRLERKRRRIILTGDVPSPTNIPSGCRFRTRCWLRGSLGEPEECEQEDPTLRELRPGHFVACHFAERI